jgi:hypothetical protein
MVHRTPSIVPKAFLNPECAVHGVTPQANPKPKTFRSPDGNKENF